MTTLYWWKVAMLLKSTKYTQLPTWNVNNDNNIQKLTIVLIIIINIDGKENKLQYMK